MCPSVAVQPLHLFQPFQRLVVDVLVLALLDQVVECRAEGIAATLKVAGVGSALYSSVSPTLDYNAGRISGAHVTANLIMTGVGFVWPVGTIISVGYSIVAEDMI